MTFKITSYGITDVGLIREKNEDVWGQISGKDFFVLADGMGGHRAGEIASRETVNSLCRYVQVSLDKEAPEGKEEIAKIISHSIQDVNVAIFTMSSQSEELRGMGTTLCCLYFHKDSVIYAHIGDSRIYRVRGEEIDQLTRDHSLCAELIDSGKMDQESSENFIYKNIITKAIGTDPEVVPEVNIKSVKHDDYYLTCSDGLSDLLSDEEIGMVIMTSNSIQDAAEKLVSRAKSEGGHDNITVILMHAEKIDA